MSRENMPMQMGLCITKTFVVQLNGLETAKDRLCDKAHFAKKQLFFGRLQHVQLWDVTFR